MYINETCKIWLIHQIKCTIIQKRAVSYSGFVAIQQFLKKEESITKYSFKENCPNF